MCLEKRLKSAVFALIAIVGSVVGAMVGYFVIASFIASGTEWIFGVEAIEQIVGEFDQRGTSYVFIAALTPAPFFVLTTAAGVAKLNFGLFLAACVIGRSLRYGVEAGIVYSIGPAAKTFIEKWFNAITITACVVILAGWALMKLM
jgi:membrane protein YqaA with SNARE-associated domain